MENVYPLAVLLHIVSTPLGSDVREEVYNLPLINCINAAVFLNWQVDRTKEFYICYMMKDYT